MRVTKGEYRKLEVEGTSAGEMNGSTESEGRPVDC